MNPLLLIKISMLVLELIADGIAKSAAIECAAGIFGVSIAEIWSNID